MKDDGIGVNVGLECVIWETLEGIIFETEATSFMLGVWTVCVCRERERNVEV